MRASAPDFTVEVRDRDFQRVGQIAPEYTDLKFVDVFNGVGAWEMKLPAEHRHLPALKAKGAGIVVTEHWTESSKQPPVYGAWNEVDRNLYTDPFAIDATRLPSSSGGTGSLVADFPDADVKTAYRWEATAANAARMIDLRVGTAAPPNGGFWLSFDIEASQPVTIEIAYRQNVGNTSSGSYVVEDRAVPAGLSRQQVFIPNGMVVVPEAATGVTLIKRSSVLFPAGAVIKVTKVKYGMTPGWFNPTAADTDVRRQGFEGALNVSQSTQEERTRTEQPDVVAHKYRVYSGRMRSARLSQDAADPKGTWLITGVHDNVVAAATSVLPDPAHDADEQALSHWEAAGDGETVMKQAVQLNAGAGAIARRRYAWLTVAPDLGRGLPVKTTSRFEGLGDLLTSLGTASGLGWRFAQKDDVVEFDVYEPADKTKLVRLDIRNGGVQSNELGFTAPSATDVFVMGQGQGEERTIRRVTTPEAQAEAAEWGIRWESTKDQRQTDDVTELEQAGLEVVAEQGVTVNSLKVVPSDHPRMRLGVDWYIGDRITAVVEGQETQALVTQVATSITSAGVIRQASIGDPVGFSFDARVASKVREVEKRVGAVERLIGEGNATAPAGVVIPFAGGVVPGGWLLADGSVYDPLAYPSLYAAIGTTYGGTAAAPKLPDLRGRVPVGRDASQVEFDTLGEAGGEKRHALTAAELPYHKHLFGGDDGVANAGYTKLGGFAYDATSTNTGNGANFVTTTMYDAANTALSSGATSPEHNNLQPYRVVNFIISVGAVPLMGVAASMGAGKGVAVGGSGTPEDPYRPNLLTDWAMMGGPLVHTGGPGGAYATTWQKGLVGGAGGVFNTTSSNLGVTVLVDGVYEAESKHRVASAGGYSTLAINGDRTALENRADGIFNHDHGSAADNYSTSQYTGFLPAGTVITMGPPSGQGGTMRFGAATFYGTLKIKRLA